MHPEFISHDSPWMNPTYLRKLSSQMLDLPDDEIHVWRIPLDLPKWQIHELEQTLSQDEELRANRFHFERHKRRYIAARGSLRKILGLYLESDPASLEFSYGPKGKPSITNGKVFFNLSHSNELALCAITRDRLIGIDIEHIRTINDVEDLSKRFFSPREFQMICKRPFEKKTETFYIIWTFKEAYLKAVGQGLGELDQVEVTFSREKPSILQKINGTYLKDPYWSVSYIKATQGYTAALAVEEGHNMSIHCFVA